MPLYVALTFDDGTIYQYFIAHLLERLRIKGTFFCIAKKRVVGNKILMSFKMIKNVSDMGHEIGSHTLTHSNLIGLSDLTLEKQLKCSKNILQKVTGKAVEGFSYPFYTFNLKIMKVVKTHYKYARNGALTDVWNISTNRYKLGSLLKRYLLLIPIKLVMHRNLFIILTFHDINIVLLLFIISYLKFFNAKFVTMGELVDFWSRSRERIST